MYQIWETIIGTVEMDDFQIHEHNKDWEISQGDQGEFGLTNEPLWQGLNSRSWLYLWLRVRNV